jgi:hypothetical protein
MTTGLAGTGAPAAGQPGAGRPTGTGGDDRGTGEERGGPRCVPGREAERRPKDPERDFAVPRHATSSTSSTVTRTNTSAIPTPMLVRSNFGKPADALPRASEKPDTKH